MGELGQRLRIGQERLACGGVLDLRPYRLDVPNTRMHVLVTDDVSGDIEFPIAWHIHHTPRRLFRWAEIDSKSASVCEVVVTFSASLRDSYAHEASK